MAELLGRGADLHVLAGHVLEQRLEIYLLLKASAERRARLLADDRKDGPTIELRVVKTVLAVDGARTRGGKAHSYLTRQLGMAAGHEGRLFLMTHLDELDCISGAADGGDDAVDAFAWIPEEPIDTPLLQPPQKKVSNGVGHARALRLCATG